MRRSAEGDGSPVASPPKAEVESGATLTAKPSARLRRGEISLLYYKEMIFICISQANAFRQAFAFRWRYISSMATYWSLSMRLISLSS